MRSEIRGSTREAPMRRLAFIRTAIPVVLAAAFTAPAPTVVEYQIPRTGAFPHDPAVGPDAVVWYTDQPTTRIGPFDPPPGQFSNFKTPPTQPAPHPITPPPPTAP